MGFVYLFVGGDPDPESRYGLKPSHLRFVQGFLCLRSDFVESGYRGWKVRDFFFLGGAVLT